MQMRNITNHQYFYRFVWIVTMLAIFSLSTISMVENTTIQSNNIHNADNPFTTSNTINPAYPSSLNNSNNLSSKDTGTLTTSSQPIITSAKVNTIQLGPDITIEEDHPKIYSLFEDVPDAIDDSSSSKTVAKIIDRNVGSYSLSALYYFSSTPSSFSIIWYFEIDFSQVPMGGVIDVPRIHTLSDITPSTIVFLHGTSSTSYTLSKTNGATFSPITSDLLMNNKLRGYISLVLEPVICGSNCINPGTIPDFVAYTSFNIDKFGYQPPTTVHTIRTEIINQDNDQVFQIRYESLFYASTTNIIIPNAWVVVSISPSPYDFDESTQGTLKLYNTVPVTYTIAFYDTTAKGYSPIQKLASWDYISTTYIHAYQKVGSYSLTTTKTLYLTDFGLQEFDNTKSYIARIAYYITSAPTSITLQYSTGTSTWSAGTSIPTTIIKRWQYMYIPVQPRVYSSEQLFKFLFSGSGTVLIGAFDIYERYFEAQTYADQVIFEGYMQELSPTGVIPLSKIESFIIQYTGANELSGSTDDTGYFYFSVSNPILSSTSFFHVDFYGLNTVLSENFPILTEPTFSSVDNGDDLIVSSSDPDTEYYLDVYIDNNYLGEFLTGDFIPKNLSLGSHSFIIVPLGSEHGGLYHEMTSLRYDYTIYESGVMKLTYYLQNGNSLDFNKFKTYINDQRIYDNYIGFEDISMPFKLVITDLFDTIVYTNSSESFEDFKDIQLTFYSVKIQNQQQNPVYVTITDSSSKTFSEWLFTNEIATYYLIQGYYTISVLYSNTSDTALNVSGLFTIDYSYQVVADTALTISGIGLQDIWDNIFSLSDQIDNVTVQVDGLTDSFDNLSLNLNTMTNETQSQLQSLIHDIQAQNSTLFNQTLEVLANSANDTQFLLKQLQVLRDLAFQSEVRIVLHSPTGLIYGTFPVLVLINESYYTFDSTNALLLTNETSRVFTVQDTITVTNNTQMTVMLIDGFQNVIYSENRTITGNTEWYIELEIVELSVFNTGEEDKRIELWRNGILGVNVTISPSTSRTFQLLTANYTVRIFQIYKEPQVDYLNRTIKEKLLTWSSLQLSSAKSSIIMNLPDDIASGQDLVDKGKSVLDHIDLSLLATYLISGTIVTLIGVVLKRTYNKIVRFRENNSQINSKL